jgi:hypothetical protein
MNTWFPAYQSNGLANSRRKRTEDVSICVKPFFGPVVVTLRSNELLSMVLLVKNGAQGRAASQPYSELMADKVIPRRFFILS